VGSSCRKGSGVLVVCVGSSCRKGSGVLVVCEAVLSVLAGIDKRASQL